MTKAKRPDDKFIGELCSGCDKPIGHEFGGEVVGLASKEWLHLDCVGVRFFCPATGKNCFHKPDAKTACSKCLSSVPTTESDIQAVIESAAQSD